MDGVDPEILSAAKKNIGIFILRLSIKKSTFATARKRW
jgi:hypothetical protein